MDTKPGSRNFRCKRFTSGGLTSRSRCKTLAKRWLDRAEDKPVTPPGDADGPQRSAGELATYRAAILEEHGSESHDKTVKTARLASRKLDWNGNIAFGFGVVAELAAAIVAPA